MKVQLLQTCSFPEELKGSKTFWKWKQRVNFFLEPEKLHRRMEDEEKMLLKSFSSSRMNIYFQR